MKKLIPVIIALCLIPLRALSQTPKLSLPKEKAEWFKNARFGLFMHWGLYSILEGTYKGHTLPDTTYTHGRSWYAEWIGPRFEIPKNEYEALAQKFDPEDFDADSWIKEAKNAGMKYFVITAKHHDGFALWDSQASDYNIMHTPYGRDILAQLVAACKKYGLRYGFYYSHWQDWHHPGGALPHWMPTRPDDDFQKYWEQKSLPQVAELIDKFNPDLLWFDTWNEESHITPQRRDELISLIRSRSSKCLINGRICFTDPGENVDFLEMFDNAYPDKLLDKPWQTPATMQHSWGYHAKDYNWKSADEMLRNLCYNASMGGNYLLNVGPKADGTLPLPAIRRMRQMGAWLLANGQAIYGTIPAGIPTSDGTLLTKKDSTLYIMITSPAESITINTRLHGTCTELETGRPIKYKVTEKSSQITLPRDLFRDSSVIVLKSEMY